MNKIVYPVLAAVLLVSSAFVAVVSVQEWKIKEDFSIKFISKDPTGIFKDFKGTIKFDDADLANSKFDLSIDPTSISTGNGMMNKKAQIEEWFNSAKYPEIKFTSSSIEKGVAGYNVLGTLKIKGVSKDVKVGVIYSRTSDGAKFTGGFNVKRSDFKVGNKSDAVPDIMKIEFSIPVAKK